jgi:hypothetical protein
VVRLVKKSRKKRSKKNIFYNNEIIRIVQASNIGDYKIDVTFSNGVQHIIDLELFVIAQTSGDPKMP